MMRAALVTLAATGMVAVGAVPAAGTLTPVLSPYIDVEGGATMPRAGSPVQGYPGAWSGGPTGFTYAWERCAATCVAIPGATGARYTPTGEDVGAGLRLVVMAQHPGGAVSDRSAVSSPVAAPVAPPAAPTVATPAGVTPSAAASAPAPLAVPALPAPSAGAPPPTVAAAIAPTKAPMVAGALRRTVGFGQALWVTGSLGPGATGRRVEVVDAGGVTVGTALADGNGAFHVRPTAVRPGTWTARSNGAATPFQVTVRPRIRQLTVTRHVARPGVVQVSGVIAPALVDKVVDLQYLDPARGWRVWRQGRTGPGGRFRIARVLRPAPGVRPFTLRVRAAVPVDVGWMFLPAVSAPRTVRVR